MNYIAAIFIFAGGMAAGSFLPICIDRILYKESRTGERSHCVCGGNALKRNKRILSVGLLNAAVWVCLYRIYGLQAETLLFALCASILIVVAVVDFRTYEIPGVCNLLIGILGIIRLFLNAASWKNYAAGFLAVSGLFLIIYIVTNGQGIGGGDIKLMAAAGLLLGWKEIIFATAAGSIAGVVIHTCRMKISREGSVLAFAPYLAFGILTAMLCGRQCIDWYLSLVL